MKKQLLLGASIMLMSIGSNAQQLWDDFDGLPSPAIANYNYVDGGWGQVNFAFTNPNATGNSSSTCLQYTKPASTYQKIYIGTKPGYAIDDISAFKAGTKTLSMKILNSAGTAITVQIGLVDNTKTGAFPAGRHSTYTAVTSTSTGWQTLTFAYDNAVSEDATVSATGINEIIIEVNGSSSSSAVYLLDDLTLANVSSTTGLITSKSANTLFKLAQNAPNPCSSFTTIPFSITSPTEVSMEILDVMGNSVYTIMKEFKSAGDHTADVSLESMKQGVYYYRLSAGGFVETKKMIVVE